MYVFSWQPSKVKSDSFKAKMKPTSKYVTVDFPEQISIINNSNNFKYWLYVIILCCYIVPLQDFVFVRILTSSVLKYL